MRVSIIIGAFIIAGLVLFAFASIYVIAEFINKKYNDKSKQ